MMLEALQKDKTVHAAVWKALAACDVLRQVDAAGGRSIGWTTVFENGSAAGEERRFLTEDPARDGASWYVYCRANPMRYLDPTGLGINSGDDYDIANLDNDEEDAYENMVDKLGVSPGDTQVDNSNEIKSGLIRWARNASDQLGYNDLTKNQKDLLSKLMDQVDPKDVGTKLEGLQRALDVAGLMPGAEVADALSGIISFLRGDLLGAGLSMAAMIPIGGQAATVSKWLKEGIQSSDEIAAALKRVRGIDDVLKTLDDLGSAGKHSVYIGVDEAGIARYVGITGRAPMLRWTEHAAATGTGRDLLNYAVVPGAQNLSKTTARVIEQNLINEYGLGKNGGQLLNKINSITPESWRLYGIK